MSGAFRPFRVMKKKNTGILYIAIPDLISYFTDQRDNSETSVEAKMWDREIEKFNNMIYEGLDHDI